jgi:ketosteroid isomerase-like protein
MDDDLVAIARKSYQAFVDGDRRANEAVIGEDFHFTSPLDNRIDRRTYFERCWPNSETISSFRFIRAFSHGDEVFVTYEAQSTSGKVFRNSEILTIRHGKIVAVEVYFGWNVPHDAPPGGFVAS